MVYSQLYFKEKNKISTLVWIFLVLLIGIFFTGLLTKTVTPRYSRASQNAMTRFEIVNLTSTQATIYWQTANKVKSFLFYGEESNNQKMVLDERDVNTIEKSSYYNHFTILKELKPGKKDFFKPVIEKQIVTKPDGSDYTFKTPVDNKIENPLAIVSGVVQQQNLQSAEGAIVILSVKDCFPLFTLSKSKGDWLIPLTNFYDRNSLEQKTLTVNETVKIEIINEDSKKINIDGTLKTISPLPQTVILGNDYKFLGEEKVLGITTDNSNQKNKIAIIYPDEEGKVISGRVPLIKGTAFPKKEIDLTIKSKKTLTAKIFASSDGSWSYVPLEDLEIGQQILIIKTTDDSNNEVTLQRKFIITGNQAIEGKVLGVASGEPTLIVSYPTLTTIPTSTPPISGGTVFSFMVISFSLIITGLGILLAF